MSAKPKITIGMAVFDDLKGLTPTIQAIRMNNREEMPLCEIVVADNNPGGKEGPHVKGFLEGWCRDGFAAPARYVPLAHPVGSSCAKQKVFEEARGEIVVCMDPHILIEGPWLKRLLEFYAQRPDTDNLHSGPLLYDNLGSVSTHWGDHWRGDMWGVWQTDPRGDPARPEYTANKEEPFAVWGCGTGLFTCRREAWFKKGGFNPLFRGFGGEEGYIHSKFRKNGAECLCLPWLRWWHRFGYPTGAPYPLMLWHRIRNYVIGLTELGIPLDRLHRHFVLGLEEDGSPRTNEHGQPYPKMPEHEWAVLMSNPAAPPETPVPVAAGASVHVPAPAGQPAPKCGSCPGGPVIPPNETLEMLYSRAHGNPSDINEHVPKLRELASQCKHVTEFGMRRGVSTVALLAGQPEKFVTYDVNYDPITQALKERQGKTDFNFVQGNSLIVDIEETDLLFIDTVHRADQVYAEVSRHAPKVRRWMVFHDTDTYGENGEGSTPQAPVPGLLPALRRYMKEHPEWSVVYHVKNNHGLTVLSRLPEDKPKLPSKVKMAYNFAKALVAHKAHGSHVCGEEQGAARLEVCSTCPHRVDNRCSVCGCFLTDPPEFPGVDTGPGKAWWKEQPCPLGFWRRRTSGSACRS